MVNKNILRTFVFFILGKPHSTSQKLRPTSPFSTDSNTSIQNQSQRPRPNPTKKQPSLPHRREGMADGKFPGLKLFQWHVKNTFIVFVTNVY